MDIHLKLINQYFLLVDLKYDTKDEIMILKFRRNNIMVEQILHE